MLLIFSISKNIIYFTWLSNLTRFKSTHLTNLTVFLTELIQFIVPILLVYLVLLVLLVFLVLLVLLVFLVLLVLLTFPILFILLVKVEEQPQVPLSGKTKLPNLSYLSHLGNLSNLSIWVILVILVILLILVIWVILVILVILIILLILQVKVEEQPQVPLSGKEHLPLEAPGHPSPQCQGALLDERLWSGGSWQETV